MKKLLYISLLLLITNTYSLHAGSINNWLNFYSGGADSDGVSENTGNYFLVQGDSIYVINGDEVCYESSSTNSCWTLGGSTFTEYNKGTVGYSSPKCALTDGCSYTPAYGTDGSYADLRFNTLFYGTASQEAQCEDGYEFDSNLLQCVEITVSCDLEVPPTPLNTVYYGEMQACDDSILGYEIQPGFRVSDYQNITPDVENCSNNVYCFLSFKSCLSCDIYKARSEAQCTSFGKSLSNFQCTQDTNQCANYDNINYSCEAVSRVDDNGTIIEDNNPVFSDQISDSTIEQFLAQFPEHTKLSYDDIREAFAKIQQAEIQRENLSNLNLDTATTTDTSTQQATQTVTDASQVTINDSNSNDLDALNNVVKSVNNVNQNLKSSGAINQNLNNVNTNLKNINQNLKSSGAINKTLEKINKNNVEYYNKSREFQQKQQINMEDQKDFFDKIGSMVDVVSDFSITDSANDIESTMKTTIDNSKFSGGEKLLGVDVHQQLTFSPISFEILGKEFDLFSAEIIHNHLDAYVDNIRKITMFAFALLALMTFFRNGD